MSAFRTTTLHISIPQTVRCVPPRVAITCENVVAETTLPEWNIVVTATQQKNMHYPWIFVNKSIPIQWVQDLLSVQSARVYLLTIHLPYQTLHQLRKLFNWILLWIFSAFEEIGFIQLHTTQSSPLRTVDATICYRSLSYKHAVRVLIYMTRCQLYIPQWKSSYIVFSATIPLVCKTAKPWLCSMRSGDLRTYQVVEYMLTLDDSKRAFFPTCSLIPSRNNHCIPKRLSWTTTSSNLWSPRASSSYSLRCCLPYFRSNTLHLRFF